MQCIMTSYEKLPQSLSDGDNNNENDDDIYNDTYNVILPQSLSDSDNSINENSDDPEIKDENILSNRDKPSLLGYEVLIGLSQDIYILIFTKIIRLFAYGFLAVMLVLYLAELGFTITNIGLLFSLTLIGDALISLAITSNADRYGRRKMLIVGGVLAVVTSSIFIITSNFWILLLVSTFGVISPSGNEIGPFMSIELSSMSEISKDSDRTRLMAWYNLVGSFSTAAGSLFCGILISTFNEVFNFSLLSSYRMVMVVYVMLKLILCFFFFKLSPAIEPKKTQENTKLFLGLHKSQAIVAKLSVLFMIDSFAGSLILQSLITNWFHLVWNTSATKLGSIIFVCNILAGISALFAARLADFIGLIMTMVVTHLPSNIMIMLVPLLPNETLAMIMLCARFSISQMDVPTRNAYVQGVVAADERSAANGITNIVRSVGASLGPFLAGLLYNNKTTISYPFYIAGLLKIIYDLLLLHSFKSIKPPEELVNFNKINDDSNKANDTQITTKNDNYNDDNDKS